MKDHLPKSDSHPDIHREDATLLVALRSGGTQGDDAVREVSAWCLRVLRRSLGSRLPADDLEDLAQDSVLRILESLDSYRGDARFRTWAASIAIRTGFTELRRRRVRLEKEDRFARIREESRRFDVEESPDRTLEHNELESSVMRHLRSDLSERQRTAILAELRGVPTVEIAHRLGCTQNALYKLVHDARRRLREALAREGWIDATGESRDDA